MPSITTIAPAPKINCQHFVRAKTAKTAMKTFSQKPRLIYLWKTLIHAAKGPEAIKDCIRRNEHVAITLYRDFAGVQQRGHGFDSTAGQPALFSRKTVFARGQSLRADHKLRGFLRNETYYFSRISL